jgi:hypothetical protein
MHSLQGMDLADAVVAKILDVTPEVQKFKPVILYMTQRRAMTF